MQNIGIAGGIGQQDFQIRQAAEDAKEQEKDYNNLKQ